MRYFRSCPWGMQLLLFLLMIFTMLGFVASMGFTLLPKFSSYSLEQMMGIDAHSPVAMIKTMLIVQGLFNTFMFLVPAWLFSYLAHPRPAAYLGLVAPGKSIQILLAVLIMIGVSPALQMIEGLIGKINFGPAIKASQAANDNMMSALTQMPDFASFVRVFIIMAIVPALGEEMFFRGVWLRFAKKKSRTMALPIVFTAAVFAYTHTNIYGLLSIFLAGVLLAVIYNLTGSLWCSILGHLFFNGSQVILLYAGKNNPGMKALMDSATVPWYLVAGGTIVFAVSFYLLWKNRTPLPSDWTEDFTPAELAREAD